MKKIYTLILAVSSLAATAQTNNDFPVTGSATIYDYSPRLYLKRSSNEGGFIQGIQTQLLDGTNNWFFGAVHEGKWTVGKGDYQNEKLTVLNNGNVGVGNDSPVEKLDINGRIKAGDRIYANSTDVNALSLVQAYNSAGGPSVLRSYSGTSYWDFAANQGAGGNSLFIGRGIDLSTDNAAITVVSNNNVGIGTSTPNSKLAVNGNIRAHEIKVETANWPDYVFAEDYELPTLQETEKHIKDKGHLPGIPSAADVKANGVDLGEMNAKLLQKIEELTLHLIEKDKEIKQLKKDRKIIGSLQERLEQLEAKVSNQK
ncbi:DUF4200 domain-containing protein [Pedobacter africanus]|uniref:Cell wall surface anchor family protein n=1 Tax=Pedobacter africanus TaxID=151894 RepID=A0A1W2BQY9_9SPHI|nr:DUF4200 domain-containing protein [Pedobacter africanus]SMC75377.1 hypothetical protein SAMN04488524_2572 [Pedobacter africanus]